jgi:D-xylose transport system substrate-binding protein
MHSKKSSAILFATVLTIGMLFGSGCTQDRGKAYKSGNKITIGFSMDTLKEERWYMDRDDFQAEAKRLDAEVIVSVAYDSASEQLKQVKSMISEGIDVIVIIPHDANIAASAVSLAKNAGIKVISYDRLVLDANVDLYISFDNVKVGELQAEAMIKAVPRGNYVIVDGPATDYNTVMIDQGIRNVLNPYIEDGKISIVKEFSTADWMSDEASDGMNKLLQNGAKIDAVIAENDSLAGGVINTLAEYHLVPDVPVVGMDADLAACQRVVEGQQLMTVYKPINKLAVAAVGFAVKMAKGEDINVTDKISDGKHKVPYYYITPEVVDKSNMVDTVIKDGFHQMSEVYMNIPQPSWPAQ